MEQEIDKKMKNEFFIVTEYSGNLFGSGGGIDVSLNDTWEQSFTAEW